ncbi:LOW QUALITY PROTEIN: T-cell ecto-ADP-ribosyltransferase 1 [Esox lucius]|uniref:LOW QUALITY PROTEIN: T-cell ecto-ADP-ribosyltransferase 1 n=1 Tax=Esox lucius TaxID=8010 RepID=UPI000576CF19|nr:LOW QUALITY PROTEIN: T-cell ecto-ADP-ribosyltransferase 1 [Esox lucius]
MALNSVDDYYKDCSKMLKKVKNYYLIQERQNDRVFNQAWIAAEDYYNSRNVPLGKLSKNNYIALQVYVNASTNFYKSFNNATRTQKTSYNTFKYHSLHFFLTDAIRKLNIKKLLTTFRGTNIRFHVKSLTIRFGQFTSSSESQIIAKGFGKKSCFEIETYFGASIKKYSYLLHEEEVLIPPYEVFDITSVKLKKHIPDLWCEAVYKLQSTKLPKSDLNCQMVRF